jgi:hypothetical protein
MIGAVAGGDFSHSGDAQSANLALYGHQAN